jgi:spore coat polysaccharide biosynthesis protein SpsF (cytidylyltransferase family)
MPLQGVPMILFQLERLRFCKQIDRIVLATSSDPSDDALAELVEQAGVSVFRGDLLDVLERFRACAAREQARVVVRLTGDCPLSDPVLIDELVEAFHAGEFDYLANCVAEKPQTVPQGFDAEVFHVAVLERASIEARLPYDREHVTPWMRSPASGLNWGCYAHHPVRPWFRVTVDYAIDFEVVSRIVDALYLSNRTFGVDQVVSFLQENPEVASLNLSIDS